MKNTKGFTIIELMIVFAVLGMLIAIIVPMLVEKSEELEVAKKQEVKEMILEENADIIQMKKQQKEGYRKL